ncbi:polymorphic toxin type 15 domain-containing protein [Shewanella chilikensis]|uniref:polymorphic toxin type 15 domain-containing protein n=1 Tax=Shewanella chilikensis TaxID=558541 RepID=UPI003003F933
MSVRLASVDSLMLHDAALIESDFTYLSDIDWQTITPTGRDRSYVIKALKHGEIVLLSDSPRLPLFSLSRNGPIVNSVYGEEIDAQVLTRLTKRFANTGGSGSQSNSNVWQPAPQLSYVADTSRVQETPPSPPPILISDNFSKSPQRLELELCYNDNEKTFAGNVPYTVIFSDPNRTVIQGVLNSKGWAMVEGGPNYPAQVIFGDEAEKVEAEAAITIQYQQLDQALDDTANHIAQQALVAKETKRVALTESFKQAVDDKIAELNAQSEAFDNLSFLSQSWQIAQATQNGATRGVTEYLPDLGEFGELMEAADIDIFMLLEAISTGDIDALEAKLRQWQARGDQGLKQAHQAMENLILLLSDPTSREMLASIPMRILEAMPRDQVAEFSAYQLAQTAIDTTIVSGGTSVGLLAGGVGGPVTATILVSAATARKSGKALEATVDIVSDISQSLKKINHHRPAQAYQKDNTLPLKGSQSRQESPAKTTKVLTAPRHNVACFNKNKKGNASEYDTQLQDQQDGLNRMTVKEYLDNRAAYQAIGRKGTGKAQREARKKHLKKLVKEYEDKFRLNREYRGQEALDKARELAEQDMKTLNALHSPDLYAGGKDEISGFGDASVNQSIGSQWKSKGDADLTRVQLMDREAQKALAQLGPNAHMNIKLHRCH